MVDNTENSMASKGGRARAESLTPRERSEIARKAVRARWDKAGKQTRELVHATHTGVLKIGETEIPCAVLEDGTRLLTQYGYFRALGRSGRPAKGRGSDFEKVAPFLALENLKPFVTLDLEDSTKPILFRLSGGSLAYGYRAETLPRVCEVYLKAREAGALLATQLKFAKACEILVRGLAHVGIIALVDEATGFQADRARNALAKILEAFVAKELRSWIPTFKADYFRELCRLRGWPFKENFRMPRFAGKLTDDLVYKRLAPGVRDELRRVNPVVRSGRRKAKHHQWLTKEHGHPKLEQHLSAVTALMRAAESWDAFEKMVNRALPHQPEMPLFDNQES